MVPEEIAPNFSAFFRCEFLQNVNDPYDTALITARNNIGPSSSNEHITYVPSILISGSEESSQVQKMPAAALMIINGDLSRQLSQESVDRAIQYARPERLLRLSTGYAGLGTNSRPSGSKKQQANRQLIETAS